jgi:hypothetical protein
MRFDRRRAAVVVLCGAIPAGCSIDDRKVHEIADATDTSHGNGGARGDASRSGGAGGATSRRDSGAAAAGGKGPGAGGDAGSSAGVPDASADSGMDGGSCTEGAGRCVDNLPSTCRGGAWEDGAPCTGNTPACSNGICAIASVQGGIASVALPSVRTGSLRLVESAFERLQTTCGTVAGNKVCVTGGIQP